MKKNKFSGIIFDMDGTLTVPVLDFRAIRLELGVTEGDLLTILNSWDEHRRRAGWEVIERHEAEAAAKLKLQPQAVEVLVEFAAAGIKFAIVTRNSMRNVSTCLKTLPVKFDRC